MTEIYEIPNNLKDLFDEGESVYRIIDYSSEMEMDNIQSMSYFLECIGATEENIKYNDGTQVTLVHPDYGMMYVIDSGGLGDFYSHKFEVSIYENDDF